MELLTIFKKNKISTGLTLSSVVLVVCCLILLLTINGAGKREIAKCIKEGGNANRVFLDFRVFTEKGLRERPKVILSPQDLRLIKNSCPEVKEIGFYTVKDVDGIRIGNSEAEVDILGAPPEYIKVMDMRLKEGRFINTTDMVYKRRVCVLGGGVGRIIAQPRVIGKKLITKNPDGKFTIIGVLEKKMPLFSSLPEEIAYSLLILTKGDIKAGRKVQALEVNNAIYIPFTTWQEWVKESDLSIISRGDISIESETLDSSLFSPSVFPPRTFICMKIDTPFEEEGREFIKDKEELKVFGHAYPIPKPLKESLDRIRQVLRKRYGENKFFHFTYVGSLRDELKDEMEDSKKVLIITSLFSLLLSGIFLSSLMLLSVGKRVSEIGVRRAFGARKKDIFLQFLGEGSMIYSLGMMIGLVVGILVSYLVVNRIFLWEFSIPIYGIITSSIFVFLVGILSSLYPAMKAANVPPAEAVRWE